MNFIYVIVNSPGAYFAEQAMISMHSLRMYNPDAHITGVMDSETLEGLSGNRERIKEYIDDVVVPKLPEGLNSTQKSRFLKTSLRKIIKGDFLFLDADTVVTGNLSEVQNLPFDIAITLNRHRAWGSENPHPMIYEYKETTGHDIQNIAYFTNYFNSGVIFSKDTEIAHIFFDRWHQLWLKDSLEFGFHKDQVAGWRANYELGNIVQELSPIYNCQFISPVYAMKFFDSAKILHYFCSTALASCLKITDKVFLEKISKNGIDEEDEQYIREIKSIFLNKLHIITDKALRNYTEDSVEQSTIELIARKISHRFPGINSFARILLRVMGK